MPIDQTNKRRTIARNFITQAEAFMRALTELKDLQDEYAKAGLTFVDTDFDGQDGLGHINAADMTAFQTKVTQIASQIVSTGTDAIFYKLKR